MVKLALELTLAPALVGGSTLASRRWGAAVGGLVSSFPAVVGPLLLITAQERGVRFTARAADGVVLGLVALSGFALAYGRLALRARWPVSLAGGWALAGSLAALLGWSAGRLGLPAALTAATVSLVFAYRALPRPRGAVAHSTYSPPKRRDIPLRMATTALLVASLATATEFLGPSLGGMLAALPVLASVLAVFTHRRHGVETLVALLQGMLAGMSGFVGFCAVVAVAIVPAGVAPAFAAGLLTALTLQALVLVRAGATRVQLV